MLKLALSFSLAAALASFATAQYLVDPSGGAVLSETGQDGTSYNGRSLGFTGRFFGESKSTVDVSMNGNLNFAGSGSPFNAMFPSSMPCIAALWDDLYIYPGNTVTEKVSPGVYYSVTWDIATFDWGHVAHQFQIVWFGAQTTINGLTFKPDDIAFCYKSLGETNVSWDITAGLNKGDQSTFVATPLDNDGLITHEEAHAVLPNFSEGGAFILFRPVGNSYAAVTMAAPAPACKIDFNGDNFVDFFDYDDFVRAFEQGC